MEQTVDTKTWAVDTAHSEVQFKIKHLVITTVTGQFNTFSGTVESQDESFENASVKFDIELDSIDTNNADRDKHLRSEDFFAVEKYPKMSYSGKLVKEGDDFALKGDLTIKETTKPVTLDVDFNGVVKDPWGNEKAGFEFSGKINRKEFGLTWNATTEAGGMLVGEEVKILGSIQLQQG